MPPLAPHMQQPRQRPLPISPPTQPVTASRADCLALYGFLKARGHVGAERGLHRKEVLVGFRKVLGRTVSDRGLQKMMGDAPKHGVPLASNSTTGYYVIESATDIDACIAELRSRIVEHEERIQALDALRTKL